MPTPTKTLQDCRDVFYGILRESEDVQAYPLVLADRFINKAQLQFCSGRIRNPLTQEEAKKGRLPFLDSDKFYTNVGTQYLGGDLTIGGDTVTVSDTSDFESSGNLFVGGNILAYTGKTSTTFTGVTGILYAFKEGTAVDVAFALPDDFMSPTQLIYNNKVKLPGRIYDNLHEDLNSDKGSIRNRALSDAPFNDGFRSNPCYTIKDGEHLLVYNIGNAGDMIHLRYEKKPTVMSGGTDLVTIDNDSYSDLIIGYLAVGEMLFNRGEEQRGMELMNIAISEAKELYSFYNGYLMEQQSGKSYRTHKGGGYNF